jgi:predicted acetyltransferase
MNERYKVILQKPDSEIQTSHFLSYDTQKEDIYGYILRKKTYWDRIMKKERDATSDSI